MLKLLKGAGEFMSARKVANTLPATKNGGAGSAGAITAGTVKGSVDPTVVLDGVNQLVSSVTDYLKVAEQEGTKRAAIYAQRDVALAAIQAQRDSVSEMMRHTFQERAAVIQKQFATLDHALATRDLALADAALKGMVGVVQASPFKSIQDMQTAMCAKDFVIRLE